MDKAALFAVDADTEEIPVAGGVIVVRGLSAYEVELCTKKSGGDAFAMNAHMLELAFVDPVMSLDDIERWKKAKRFDQTQQVMDTVNRLSGIGKYAQKEAYKSDGSRSIGGVPDHAGPEAGPDGS